MYAIYISNAQSFQTAIFNSVEFARTLSEEEMAIIYSLVDENRMFNTITPDIIRQYEITFPNVYLLLYDIWCYQFHFLPYICKDFFLHMVIKLRGDVREQKETREDAL